MAKVDSKVVTYALLSVLLLLQLSSQVGGQTIAFYDGTGCTGGGVSCQNMEQFACCYWMTMETNSVLSLYGGNPSAVSVIYNGGECSKYATGGSGEQCYTGQFTGGTWYQPREQESAACDTQMKPNAVVFTEDSTKGQWVLTSSNAEELSSQMQNVPDGEKTNWLKSQGATYNEL